VTIFVCVNCDQTRPCDGRYTRPLTQVSVSLQTGHIRSARVQRRECERDLLDATFGSFGNLQAWTYLDMIQCRQALSRHRTPNPVRSI